ncbi:MAG: DegT/DnrJ/EryC1/StrS aminotransferase family protein [Ruminococcaceae bacterium]|nr:DegT/DnrJ/EryC1/StrS aminotransferase family protein [Oscillospiraceae bacterium]
MNIKFSPPDISEKEIQAVADALRSGWITTGPKVKKFEAEISKFLGVNKCACLNSQTACAEIALRLLGIGEDDEIITTAYTYTATASVVCHVGAKLILVDIQKDNFEMDYDKLESLITPKTKVIIPVDIGGVPCDYNRIFEIVERKKRIFEPNGELQKSIGRIAILADCAHSFGAQLNGKMIGTIADFSAFSFHAVKNLTTAEGGVLSWNKIPNIDDEDIYKRIQLMSLHGQSKDAFSKNQLGSWEYDIVGTWYKCNMTDIMAAVGLAQLERYPEMLLRRREIINKYNQAFERRGLDILRHYGASKVSSGHLYITRIPKITQDQRNEIILKMAEAGIACNVHYKPLPMHTAYKNLGFNIKDFPNAYDHFANEITLPLNTTLTDTEVDYIIENYLKILEEYT